MVTFAKCYITLLIGLLLQSYLVHYGEGVGEIENQNNDVKASKPFEQLIPNTNSDSSKESSATFSKTDETEIAKDLPVPPFVADNRSVATNFKTGDVLTKQSSSTLSAGGNSLAGTDNVIATSTLSNLDKSEKESPASSELTKTDGGDNEGKTQYDRSREEGEDSDKNRKSNKIGTAEKPSGSRNMKLSEEEKEMIKTGDNELVRLVEPDSGSGGITNSTDNNDVEKENSEESVLSKNSTIVDDSGERNASSSRIGKIRNFHKPWLSSTERFYRPDEFFSRPTSFQDNSEDWQPINGHGQKRPQGFTITTESPSETEILKRIVTSHTSGPRIATNPSFKRRLVSSTSTESMPLYSASSSTFSPPFFSSAPSLPINAAVRKPPVVSKPIVSPGSNRRKVPVAAVNDPSLPTTSTAWALATLKSHADKFSRRPVSDSVKKNNITFFDAESRRSTTIKPFVSWSTRLQKPIVFEQNDGVKVSTSSAADERSPGDPSITTVSYVTELEHIVVNNTASSSSTPVTNKLDTGETDNGNDDIGNGSSLSADNVNYYNTSSSKWGAIKDDVSGDLLRVTSASPEIINGSSQSTISTINFQPIIEQTGKNQLSNNNNNNNNNSSSSNSNNNNNNNSNSNSNSSSNRQQNTEPIVIQGKRNQSLWNFENQSLSIAEEKDSIDNVNRNVVEREEQQPDQVLSYELNNETTPPTAIQNDVLVTTVSDAELSSTTETENISKNFNFSKINQSDHAQSQTTEMELPTFTKTNGLPMNSSSLEDEDFSSAQNETRNQLPSPTSQNLIEQNKLEDGEAGDMEIAARPAEAEEKNSTVVSGRPDYHDKSPVATRDNNVVITANTIIPSLVITSDDGKNTLIKIDLPAKEVIAPKNGSSSASNHIFSKPSTEAVSAISSATENRNEVKPIVSDIDIVTMSTNQLQKSDNDNDTTSGDLSDEVVDEKLHIQNNEDAILSNEVSSTLKPFLATSENLPAGVVAPTEITQDVDYQQPTYVTNIRDNDLSVLETHSRKNASIAPNESFTTSTSWNTSTVSAIPNTSRFTVVENSSIAGPMLEFPDTVTNYSSSTPAYTLHRNNTSTTPKASFTEITTTSTSTVPRITTTPGVVFNTSSTAAPEKVTFSSHSFSSIVPENSSSRNSFTKATDNGIDTTSKSVISSIRNSSTSFIVRTSQSSSSSSASPKSPATFSPSYDVTLSGSTVVPSKNSSSESENKTKKNIFSHQHRPDIPAYFDIVFKSSAKHLCHLSHLLRESMSRYITSRSSKSFSPEQIIMVVDPNQCKNPDDSTQLISVTMYVLDDDQAVLAELKKILHTDEVNVTLPIHKITFHGDSRLSDETRNIAVVGVACIVILSFAMIFFLICMIRNRQKGVYGQRCTPVSMDDYSLDNISVYNSARRKSKLRASRRSYGNPAFEDPSVPSRPLTYNGLLKAIGNKSELDEEFSQIPTVVVRPDELPPGAEAKNRYSNVIPLPETRVSLSASKNNAETVHSYINANYVKGFKGQDKFYIACQAPLQSTIEDFWKMIWKEQSKVIIMLTALVENGVEKCADYLPPSEVLDCHRLFGDFQITLKKREVREKYVMSSLQLKNMENNLWREITHFWYTNWPLQGVPAEQNSIIAMILEARSYMRNNTGPLIAHCSPGTGRTGTVIVCDICIREYEQSKTVNIPATVSMLRRCRAGSVQTKDQYSFIYKVLALYAKKLNDSGSLDSI